MACEDCDGVDCMDDVLSNARCSGYLVGTEYYKNNAVVVNKCKNILKKYAPGQHLDSMDMPFILDILKNHEEYESKVGAGIASIYVNITRYNNKCFWIQRIDGSTTDFSYIKCIRHPTNYQLFSAVCRRIVNGQVLEFKDKWFGHNNFQGIVKCPITDTMIDWHEAQVDHKAPKTFKWLVDNFIGLHQIDLNKVVYKKNRDGMIGSEFEDLELNKVWYDYHKANAELQVVSILANTSILRKVN